jgi:hypothetical protein
MIFMLSISIFQFLSFSLVPQSNSCSSLVSHFTLTNGGCSEDQNGAVLAVGRLRIYRTDTQIKMQFDGVNEAQV